MRAILLAAGIGSRLRPLTNNTPKCLMPIKGQPLLGVWLGHLSQANIGPFLINTHYLADQVESFIEASNYKNQVTLVNEPDLEGTAGTLIKNINFFQAEDGLLIHADNYCLADFIAFQEAHHNRPPECLMTMMTFRTDDPSSCGIVDLNERGIVTGFYEKLTKSEVFSGDNVINLFPVYYQIVNLLKALQDIVWFYIYVFNFIKIFF